MSDRDEMEAGDQPLDTVAKNRELESMALNKEEYEMIE